MNGARFVLAIAVGLVVRAVASAQGTCERISVDSSGAQGNGYSVQLSMSADGQFVAFWSNASNLVAGDTNGVSDVFVRDRTLGTTVRVSVDSSGKQASYDCGHPQISSDGWIVTFSSQSGDLVSGDTNGKNDVFVHDRSTGVTSRVSIDSSGAQVDGSSQYPMIDSDGTIVAFLSDATTLVTGDGNGKKDVFVHDRSTGITERISVDSSGTEGNDDSYTLDSNGISSDGRIVAFESDASNLVAGDTNGFTDVFVHDRTTGITERVSTSTTGVEANEVCFSSALSSNGEVVAFKSAASTLVPGDTNRNYDIFVHDRSTGILDRVSVDSSGVEANGESDTPALTADGRFVFFSSIATNLVPGDTNGEADLFVHDRLLGTTELVEVDWIQGKGSGDGWPESISADGRVIAFYSDVSDFVAGDTNHRTDDFVFERSIAASWTNYGAGFPGTNGIPWFTAEENPVLGTTITLDIGNSYALPTAGLLFVGFQTANLHTSWGGDLSVLPVLTLPITFSYGFDSFMGDIPPDPSFDGARVDAQVLEADPGAMKGVSFTQGLELVLGN